MVSYTTYRKHAVREPLFGATYLRELNLVAIEVSSSCLNGSVSHAKPSHSDVMKFCVKYYLKDIKGAQNELERALERYLKISDVLSGIDYSTNLGIDTSPTVGAMDAQLIARSEAFEAYTDTVAQVQSKIEQAKALIAKTPYGYLLWAHYIHGTKWSVLALRERVHVSTMRRWQAQAIETLYRIMPEEYRRYSIPNAEPKA